MYKNVNDSTSFAIVRFLSYNKMCKLLKNQYQNSKKLKKKMHFISTLLTESTSGEFYYIK